MKQLLQMDSSKVMNHYLDTKTIKLLKPYDRSKASFIPHLLSLFATIPLVRNTNWKPGMVSMAKTMAAIPERHMTSEGEFSRKQIMTYLRIVAIFPRTQIMTGSQVANPTYSALTPLFMYAHKLYNDVGYDEWDWEDARIDAALGEFLAKANNFRKAWPDWDFTSDGDLPTIRDKIAKDKKYTDWNNWATRIVQIEAGEDADIHVEDVKIPKEICLMQYQFWCANAQLRDTSANLLDIYHYGQVPRAMDCIAKIKAKAEEEWA